MTKKFFITIGLMTLGLFGFGYAASAGYTTNQLGENSCILSADGQNFACSIFLNWQETKDNLELPRDEQKTINPLFAVKYNGQELTQYYVLSENYYYYFPKLLFSPDGKKFVYTKQEAGAKDKLIMNNEEMAEYDTINNIVFSPDSQRLAFTAIQGQQQLVVLDSQVLAQYNIIPGDINGDIHNLSFSPDSKKLAYTVTNRNGELFAVLDGVTQEKYKYIHSPTFSPDSRQYVYYAVKEDGTKVLVINGLEQILKGAIVNNSPQASIKFSPDSKRLIYFMENSGGKQVLVDNDLYKSGIDYYDDANKGYDQCDSMIFSPDSEFFAYRAVDSDQEFVVVDDMKFKKYLNIGYPVFSSKSRLAYSAKIKSGAYIMVIDDQEQLGEYDYVDFPHFSPDGNRLAYYIADEGKSFHVIYDLRQGTKIKTSSASGDITFSPDSQHYTYTTKDSVDGPWHIILDNKDIGKFDIIFDYVFSPDSKELIYLVLENGNLVKKTISLSNGQASNPPVVQVSGDFAKKNAGKIFLQVQSRGEAWYVWPKDAKRYYLKDGPTAYEALRKLGLGITNKDLALIPVGLAGIDTGQDSDSDGLSDNLEKALGTDPNDKDSDHDTYSDGTEVKGDYNPLGAGKMKFDTKTSQRLEGQILLQVESKGEAWYVKGGKRYYMANGQDAYQIMRQLSIGITNADLSKIGEGNL